MATSTQTPMMQQWHACKEAAPETILFFRLGDFYEAFFEDAEVLAKEIDLTLTKRQEVPMAGVPHHMLDTYVDRMVAKGYRIAIAEQVENPKEVKGIVKREVVRVVTPGTVISSSLIEDKVGSFLASLFQLNKGFALACLDITTATFFVLEFETKEGVLDELFRIAPKEMVLPKKWKDEKEFLGEVHRSFRPTVHFLEAWHFDHKCALDTLCKHFGVETLDGFGLKGMTAAINAAGALLTYVSEELNLPIDHIKGLKLAEKRGLMQIDSAAVRNLELIRPLHEGQKEATLLHLLDGTKTAMGGRMLRSWILHPLLSCDTIQKRQDRVQKFMEDFPRLLELRKSLGEVRDLERIMMRIETGYASPRDLVALRFSLEEVPKISELTGDVFSDLSAPARLIETALVDAPPMRLSDGGLFKRGFHGELDELLGIKADSKTWVAGYQTRLRDTYGIKTLKVGYTKAFGYYIEVSKAQSSKVPEGFQRRQTLVNAERFITPELKEFEHKILSADEKIKALESTLFLELRSEIARYADEVRRVSKKIAGIDCTSSLAKIALERDYVKPTVDESNIFEIDEGRHPVIERSIEEAFIPNDLTFGGGQMALITGPNMAGKSTFIRQAALIAILAQIGSYVPAKRAHIGIIDKVFSRIGASDDLARGQSTFMVEMSETANILNNATERSLVILDEIGRGTSTYDGISIAWAVAEYLLTTPGKQAKTLFATHYFEITELAKQHKSVFNLNVAVAETGSEIAFLHKICPGIADKSYGIHVAKLAGLPHSALKIAAAKLKELETGEMKLAAPSKQLDLFSAKEEPPSIVLSELADTDTNTLTPLEALQLLSRWKDAL